MRKKKKSIFLFPFALQSSYLYFKYDRKYRSVIVGNKENRKASRGGRLAKGNQCLGGSTDLWRKVKGTNKERFIPLNYSAKISMIGDVTGFVLFFF
jgi:hypothetical protein